MDLPINMWAVLLAAVSSMVVGGIWYAKPVFGTVWGKLVKVGLDDKKTRDMAPKALIVAFLLSLIMAYVLAHVAALSNAYFQYGAMTTALTTAFWLWLGIAFTRTVTHDLFEQRPMKLTAINIGNQFVTLMVMALVIGAFGGY